MGFAGGLYSVILELIVPAKIHSPVIIHVISDP